MDKYIMGNGGIENITAKQAINFFENKLIPKLNQYIGEAIKHNGNINDYFKHIVKK